jgi:hypothetical protein
MSNQCTQIRTRIGSWNVQTLFQKGKLAQLNREMDRYKLDILGISEVRWNGSGQIMTTNVKMFLYSGMLNEEDTHVRGVGILFNKGTKNALLEWNPLSERIITAWVKTKNRKMTIVQCCAPTEDEEPDEMESFYSLLDKTLVSLHRSDIILMMGD